jgi:hypothetical protein
MIDQTPEAVIEWVALMRRLGIKRLGSIELWPDAPTDPQPASEKDLADLLGPEPTPEDLLAWSVAGPLPSELTPPTPE